MRKYVSPALAVLLVLTPQVGSAFAATTTTPSPAATSSSIAQSKMGTIKSLDLTKRSLTLADGSSYVLPAGFKLPNVKVGDKVTVHWKMDGTAHDVTAIDIG